MPVSVTAVAGLQRPRLQDRGLPATARVLPARRWRPTRPRRSPGRPRVARRAAWERRRAVGARRRCTRPRRTPTGMRTAGRRVYPGSGTPLRSCRRRSKSSRYTPSSIAAGVDDGRRPVDDALARRGSGASRLPEHPASRTTATNTDCEQPPRLHALSVDRRRLPRRPTSKVQHAGPAIAAVYERAIPAASRKHHVGEHRVGVDVVHDARHLQQDEAVQRRPEFQRGEERVVALEAVRGQHLDHRSCRGARRLRVLGIVTAEGHPGECRVPTRMVMRVTAVCAGHGHHRIVAGATVPDGVEHSDDVADHPHPDGSAQVLEAVHVVVERGPLRAELRGQCVDRQRIPALAVQKRECGVDDGVPAQLGRTPGASRSAGRCGSGRSAPPAELPCAQVLLWCSGSSLG